VVTNGRFALDGNSNATQLLPEIGTVGINGLTNQQFIANGDYFRFHGTKIRR
jgi:hypothetical protein